MLYRQPHHNWEPTKRYSGKNYSKLLKGKKGRDCLSLTFYFPLFWNSNAAVEVLWKLKAKRVLLDSNIFLSWVDHEINMENAIPTGLSCRVFDKIFTTTSRCIKECFTCSISLLYKIVVYVLYNLWYIFLKEWNQLIHFLSLIFSFPLFWKSKCCRGILRATESKTGPSWCKHIPD